MKIYVLEVLKPEGRGKERCLRGNKLSHSKALRWQCYDPRERESGGLCREQSGTLCRSSDYSYTIPGRVTIGQSML